MFSISFRSPIKITFPENKPIQKNQPPAAERYQSCSNSFNPLPNPFPPKSEKVLNQTPSRLKKAVPSSESQETALKVIDVMEQLLRRDPLKLRPLIKQSLKALCLRTFRSEDNSTIHKQHWFTYCVDLSILLNSISFIILLAVKHALIAEQHSENSPNPSEEDAPDQPLRDSLSEALSEPENLLTDWSADLLSENTIEEDDPLAHTLLATLEEFLSVERHLLFGLGFCHLVSSFFFKRAKTPVAKAV